MNRDRRPPEATFHPEPGVASATPTSPGADPLAMPPEPLQCHLPHLGLLTVSGEDAGVFLQGQITQDINQIDETRSRIAAHCNPKGRMLALFRVFCHAGGYQLLLPREQIPTLRKRLQLYVLRSRVTLGETDDDFAVAGISGPSAETLLPTPADQVDGVSQHQGLRITRLPGDTPRFLLMGEKSLLQQFLGELSQALPQVETSRWRLLDIAAGIPSLYPATADQFVPQMVNLDILQGISFKKGCYTGQEIVARSHYLGKLKRRMLRLTLDAGHAQPGMPVVSEEDPGQPAGMVVDSAPGIGGGEALLAVLRIATLGSALHLESIDGPRLNLAGLPYALPEL